MAHLTGMAPGQFSVHPGPQAPGDMPLIVFLGLGAPSGLKVELDHHRPLHTFPFRSRRSSPPAPLNLTFQTIPLAFQPSGTWTCESFVFRSCNLRSEVLPTWPGRDLPCDWEAVRTLTFRFSTGSISLPRKLSLCAIIFSTVIQMYPASKLCTTLWGYSEGVPLVLWALRPQWGTVAPAWT